MRTYSQINKEEREKIYIMRKSGKTMREIGEAIGRSHTSISRELYRNGSLKVEIGYLPDTADLLSKERKAKHGMKLQRNPFLLNKVISRMRDARYSPEMVAGELKLLGATVRISTEAIYQFAYSPEGKELGMYKYLMRARPKRNQLYGRKPRNNHGIPERVPISERPEIKKEEFGHFEVDTTFFKGNRQINLLTIVERKTGFLLAELNQSKHSDKMAFKLLDNLIKFPKKSRRTVTMDNGKEFVLHNKVKFVTGTPTYFCNPGSPWEKPYVENTHAILHRFLPKNRDPKTLTNQEVQDAIAKTNNLPRKRLTSDHLLKCWNLKKIITLVHFVLEYSIFYDRIDYCY
jgi:IS30 family transposase